MASPRLGAAISHPILTRRNLAVAPVIGKLAGMFDEGKLDDF
jgi:hypothetical protein